MKKTLVTVDNLETFICKERGVLSVDGSFLLTPGAKDALAKRGVALVHGPSPETAPVAQKHSEQLPAASAGEKRLLLAVAAMLHERCGIHEPQVLQSLSRCIVDTIRDNI
jgi:hypothetical protein